MARRNNFLDGNDNFREQNLRFVRNEMEDNFNQFFGGSKNNAADNDADIAPNAVAPPRDSKVVQPTPAIDLPAKRKFELEQRRQFMRELGLSRSRAQTVAADSLNTPFDMCELQQRRTRMFLELGSSNWVEVDAQIIREISALIESHKQSRKDRPRAPPLPSDIKWNAGDSVGAALPKTSEREVSPENYGLVRRTDENFHALQTRNSKRQEERDLDRNQQIGRNHNFAKGYRQSDQFRGHNDGNNNFHDDEYNNDHYGYIDRGNPNDYGLARRKANGYIYRGKSNRNFRNQKFGRNQIKQNFDFDHNDNWVDSYSYPSHLYYEFSEDQQWNDQNFNGNGYYFDFNAMQNIDGPSNFGNVFHFGNYDDFQLGDNGNQMTWSDNRENNRNIIPPRSARNLVNNTKKQQPPNLATYKKVVEKKPASAARPINNKGGKNSPNMLPNAATTSKRNVPKRVAEPLQSGKAKKQKYDGNKRVFIVGGFKLPYVHSKVLQLPQPEAQSYAVTFYEHEPIYNTSIYALDNNGSNIELDKYNDEGDNTDDECDMKPVSKRSAVRKLINKNWNKVYRERNYICWLSWWKAFKWCELQINKKLQSFGSLSVKHKFLPYYWKRMSTAQVINNVMEEARISLKETTSNHFRDARTLYVLMNETFLENVSPGVAEQLQRMIRKIPNDLWLYKMRSMVYIWAEYFKLSSSKNENGSKNLASIQKRWKSPVFHWLCKQAFDELKTISAIEWPKHTEMYSKLKSVPV